MRISVGVQGHAERALSRYSLFPLLSRQHRNCRNGEGDSSGALHFCLLAVSPTRAEDAQSSAPEADTTEVPAETIRIFFDCRGNCYEDFLKTELQIVNFVRDRKAGQTCISSLLLNLGKRPATNTHLRFVVGKASRHLRHASLRDHPFRKPDDVIRRRLLNTVKLGLARYIARTPRHIKPMFPTSPAGLTRPGRRSEPQTHGTTGIQHDFNVELSGERSKQFVRCPAQFLQIVSLKR